MSRVGETRKVLIAEDEEALRRALARALARAGHEVVEAADGTAAIASVGREPFDVILTDIAMPGANGIDVLRAVRERDFDVPVVLMTGAPDLQSALEAMHLGVLEYLTKPVDIAKLVATVERASRLHRLARAKRKALEMIEAGDGAGAGDRAGLEAAFDRMLGTLTVAFQPIVRGEQGALFGYEALMRSREPALPHPGAVLHAAERLDRLDDLGRRIRALIAEPLGPAGGDGPTIFVNLHPRDLGDDTLIAADAPLAMHARRVIFEITERAALDEVSDARERIAALRDRGYRIAVDDLGAGYAGLTSFVQLEPDLVKLDMSLVRDVDRHPTKQKLVASLAGVCREMGLSVVAEGVETVAERDMLRGLGCDLLQGYLFAKPGPPFPAPHWP